MNSMLFWKMMSFSKRDKEVLNLCTKLVFRRTMEEDVGNELGNIRFHNKTLRRMGRTITTNCCNLCSSGSNFGPLVIRRDVGYSFFQAFFTGFLGKKFFNCIGLNWNKNSQKWKKINWSEIRKKYNKFFFISVKFRKKQSENFFSNFYLISIFLFKKKPLKVDKTRTNIFSEKIFEKNFFLIRTGPKTIWSCFQLYSVFPNSGWVL